MIYLKILSKNYFQYFGNFFLNFRVFGIPRIYFTLVRAWEVQTIHVVLLRSTNQTVEADRKLNRRSTLNGRRSTVHSRRSTLKSRRSTLNSRRSTLNNRRSTVHSRRPTLNSRPYGSMSTVICRSSCRGQLSGSTADHTAEIDCKQQILHVEFNL